MRRSPPSSTPSSPRLAVVREGRANASRAGIAGERVEALDPLWARYRDNLARHLIGLAREFQTRLLRELSERGYAGLRPAFGPLLGLISREGRAPGVLASQLATSPQAASQLVRLAEEAGYLERREDPADRRAKLVVPTTRGRALIEEARGILRGCEAQDRELLGAPEDDDYRESLARVAEALGATGEAEASRRAYGSGSIGLLPLIAVRIQRELMEATRLRGHRGLKMSHGQILPLLGADGARIHELARLQQVTRQAISATAHDLESQGYVRRAPDPRDRRGVVLQLSERGTELIRDSVAALDELDRRLAEQLGRERFDRLEQAARRLYRAMRLEEEIFDAREPSAPAAAPTQDAPEGGTSPRDLRRLAARLRRQLGDRDAARLAALLEGRAVDAPEPRTRPGSDPAPRTRPTPRSRPEEDSGGSLFRSNVR